jgi:hypothetical protein
MSLQIQTAPPDVRAELSQKQLLQISTQGMQIYMKSSRRLNTIKDLENIYYPWLNRNSPLFNMRLKADDPTLTSTTSYLTTTYGPILWNQINMEANAWGLLPKKPWDRRGWRLIKARSTAGGGIAENSVLPETDQPDLAVASAAPKTIAHNFDLSWQALLESRGQDDVVGDPMATYRNYTADEHAKDLNGYLMQDFDTLAGNNIESLDRLTATNSEQAGVGATANDEDIFGIDKSATPTLEPYSDHNSNVDRALTIPILNALIRNTRPYWSDRTGKNCIYITGHDTADKVAELLQAQQRFMDVNISPETGVTRAGVSTREGIDGGFSVMQYRNIGIFETIDTTQDGASRFYLIDTGNTFIKTLAPTQYFQTGVESGEPFILNKLNEEGMYVTIAELNGTMFKANGKIRDILA